MPVHRPFQAQLLQGITAGGSVDAVQQWARTGAVAWRWGGCLGLGASSRGAGRARGGGSAASRALAEPPSLLNGPAGTCRVEEQGCKTERQAGRQQAAVHGQKKCGQL